MKIEVLKSAKTLKGNIIELLSPNYSKKSGIVLVIGVFHGDEPQGKYLIERYLNEYSGLDAVLINSKNSMLFIPCLNPDGMELHTRTNANGVDLNRNFPTANWGKNEGENADCDIETSSYFGGKSAASEIETNFVIDIIESYKPDLILTLHAPYKVVNYDGPAEKIAAAISEITGYPAEASIGYPTPGSFGNYCGVERNIPVITLELDEEIPVENLFQPVSAVLDYISAV